MANHNQAYKGQTYAQTAEPIRYPTPITPVRPPVLIQQITIAWNKLSRWKTEMAETSKLLKNAIRNTYKKSIAFQIHPLRKLLTL